MIYSEKDCEASMNVDRFRSRHGCILAAVVLAICATCIIYYNQHSSLPFHSKFRTGELRGWSVYGGSWQAGDEILQNITAGRGDKVVLTDKHWSNYRLDTDIRIDSVSEGMHWGDAGVIMRVSDPAVGVDSYQGYYLGVGFDDQILFIGKAGYSWNRLASSRLNDRVSVGTWYHLSAQIEGCSIEAEITSDGHAPTKVSYYDENCRQRTGSVGLRTFNVQATWRNFVLTEHD